VAILYRLHNERWLAEGWWAIDPSSEVKTISTPNSTFYYYAVSEDVSADRKTGAWPRRKTIPGTRTEWQGSGEEGSVWVDVVSERFEHYLEEQSRVQTSARSACARCRWILTILSFP
jgi:uncharacterized membrane protein